MGNFEFSIFFCFRHLVLLCENMQFRILLQIVAYSYRQCKALDRKYLWLPHFRGKILNFAPSIMTALYFSNN